MHECDDFADVNVAAAVHPDAVRCDEVAGEDGVLAADTETLEAVADMASWSAAGRMLVVAGFRTGADDRRAVNLQDAVGVVLDDRVVIDDDIAWAAAACFDALTTTPA